MSQGGTKLKNLDYRLSSIFENFMNDKQSLEEFEPPAEAAGRTNKPRFC